MQRFEHMYLRQSFLSSEWHWGEWAQRAEGGCKGAHAPHNETAVAKKGCGQGREP